MLFNQANQQVKVADRFDSVSNPKLFAPLHEVLKPTENYCGKLFHLETRAHITDHRK